MDIRVGSSADMIVRYKIFGVDGNLTCNGLQSGIKIVCWLRYLAADNSSLEDLIAADAAQWQQKNQSSGGCTIVNGGKSYTRCKLDPGGMVPVTKEQATGRATSQGWRDAMASFTSDDSAP